MEGRGVPTPARSSQKQLKNWHLLLPGLLSVHHLRGRAGGLVGQVSV